MSQANPRWALVVAASAAAAALMGASGCARGDATQHGAATPHANRARRPGFAREHRFSRRGNDWEPTAVADPGCPRPQFVPASALAIDRAGTIVYAYARSAVAHRPSALYTTTSSDGVAWSAPGLISSAGDSVFPVLTAGRTPGDFRLAWQDDRAGAARAWNTYYARSIDGGGSWSHALRLSNVATGARYKSRRGYRFPYGDYMGLAVNASGEAVATWGEGNGWESTGGTWLTKEG